jgi:uncharacterized membrane protein HdeD (DUF308 family)
MKAWIPIAMNLYRGGAAVVLGILLLFMPDKSSGFLFNLMGFFWLSIGFAVLRRSEEDARYPGRHTALIAGVVALVAGLLVLTRSFTRQWIGEDFVVFVFGSVILVTGLLHLFGEVRIGGITTNRVTTVHFLLGILEVLLGGLLILSPQMDQPFVYWAATAWALIYGVMSLSWVVREVIKRRQDKKSSETAGKSNRHAADNVQT